jgi:NADPH:quinone reductase-like Zn-dependent oxidoreductase
MNGLTARLALDLIKLSAGETLAVSGGAGLLAHYMIVMAKQRGLRVIADAKPSETELVRSYGADVVVPRGDRFGSEVRAEAPGGVDALFDTAVLGRDSFSAIRDSGAYVPVRGWDGSPSERDIRISPVMYRSDRKGGPAGECPQAFCRPTCVIKHPRRFRAG